MKITVKVTYIDNGIARFNDCINLSISNNTLTIIEDIDNTKCEYTETMRYIKSVEIEERKGGVTHE